jgi:hypothetical protein
MATQAAASAPGLARGANSDGNPRSGYSNGGNPYGNPTVDFVGALGNIGDKIGAYRQQGAVNDALSDATGEDGNIDFGAAMAGALRAGDLKTAAALGTMADRKFNEQKDTRDFGFRQSEAGRAQSNADRSFGLQERQFNEGVNRNERDFGLKQQEFNARFNGEACRPDSSARRLRDRIRKVPAIMRGRVHS